MAKAMTMIGMVVAGLLAVMFALDLAVGVPFAAASAPMDIGMLLCSLILGYLSFNAFRDIR
ncbi:hypothetical protein Pla123a_16470 [Posidoniimonas polymericola]|uniref:Uncharacterized protein n=1 Tax=Posidoniimonas polymericola TaxID=2528002 RepID=A0A5C5YSC9_9BACT|nr:hypothetical protein [Posidoniimonas polymericola]TWT77849.1 hypothetical protein Pla123a_16470 [Posidoniimonas polymericola]